MKPTILRGFDYKAMAWADLAAEDAEDIEELVPFVPAEGEAAEDETLVAGLGGLPAQACRGAAAGLNSLRMIDAAVKALRRPVLAAACARVLLKSIGLALLLIVIIGIGLQSSDRRARRQAAPPGPSRPRALRRTPPGRRLPSCSR